MYKLTGNKEFLQEAISQLKKHAEKLEDPKTGLWYHGWDNDTIPSQDPCCQPGWAENPNRRNNEFWGRGNGWVLGGLAEILQVLPKEESSYDFYKQLFVTLATRVAELQSPDGYWHASLLDPASYPSPETSATGFIVYALAYGVNEGLLDKAFFMPAIEKGWKALVDAVEPDGKLGYVQPIGADPRKVTREMTEVYGVGAFLLAGCQIYKMIN